MALIRCGSRTSSDFLGTNEAYVSRNTASGAYAEKITLQATNTFTDVNALFSLIGDVKNYSTVSINNPAGTNILDVCGIVNDTITHIARSVVSDVDISGYDYIYVTYHHTGAAGALTISLA